jgi:hypothetical protein
VTGLCCWTTPNRHNVTQLLQEANLPCRIEPLALPLGQVAAIINARSQA